MRERTATLSLRPSAFSPVTRVKRKPPVADPSPACIFCDPALPLASTGMDALGFVDHLAVSVPCEREYEMWRQVIRDEWQGD